MKAPPNSPEHEQYVLGAVLLSDSILSRLVLVEGLKAEHFYSPQNAEVFAAMLRLHGRDEPVDVATIKAELERSQATAAAHVTPGDLDLLSATVPAVANAGAYAKRVVELADLRREREAALQILEGVETEDKGLIAEGKALAMDQARRGGMLDSHASAMEVLDYMEEKAPPGWELPWSRLNALGIRFRRKAMTVLGAHSSHGKSVCAGQITESVAQQGARVAVYIAEGSTQDWTLRAISRRSSLHYSQLQLRQLQGGQHERFVRAAEWWRELGITLVDAHGWTAEEIALHARSYRWDFVAIDMFHTLNHGGAEVRDLDASVGKLYSLAGQADCHVLLLAHVNEARSGTHRPPPVLGDLRGTGMLKNDADNVMFVWREQSKDGTEPLQDGRIYIAKGRNTDLGGMDVIFNGAHQRFVEMAG